MISNAQKRSDFLNSLTILSKKSFLTIALRITAAKSLRYLEFLSNKKSSFVKSVKSSVYSNSSHYISTHLTSR